MTGRIRAFDLIPGSGIVEAQSVEGILPIDSQDEGDYRLYRITLPFLPPSKNQYDTMHWGSQRSVKKKWVTHLGWHVRALRVPQAEKIGLAAILVFPTNRKRDWQNYSSTLWNFVPDALQASGVIDGDHAGKIEFPPNLGIVFAVDNHAAPKEKRQRTQIILTMRVADIR